MNRLAAGRRALLLVWVTLAAAAPAKAEDVAPDLPRTLAALDEALFDAFNRCDLEKFSALLAEDLEFYHDQGGLTRGRQGVTESVRKNICGQTRRELVPGTLEVYPMHGYGAVQIGRHRFYRSGATEPTGEARFVHLWEHKDGAWRITRVISYDHQAVQK